jgi:sensor histidine kinase YesM
MLIQPLLENAIKHAFLKEQSDGEITLDFTILEHKEQIRIVVRDNGIGIDRTMLKKPSKSNSHALDIIQERITMLNIREQIDYYSLVISDLSKEGMSGTTCVLTVPLSD